MKTIIYRLLFVITFFINAAAMAQGRYNISGTIADEKGQPIKSATVFISGSQKITITDDEGRFMFVNMDAGTYQVSAHMLGYSSGTKDATIQARPVNVTIVLKEKTLVLNEVLIGSTGDWERRFALFKEKFLGTSSNARNCTILNPKIINFTLRKGVLTARSDDFLIIENKQLGYRIKYLLKYFSYNSSAASTGYDGDASFEELNGTEKMKDDWAANRLETYKGSFMHFLRSVYWNTTLKEGFLTHYLYADSIKLDRHGDEYAKVLIGTGIVKFDTLVTAIDTSFISLKFTHLYITYNPKAAAAAVMTKEDEELPKKSFELTNKGSIIKSFLKEAIIDRKGSYTDYRAFLIRGNWSRKRIGDQLPFEYQPPKN